MTVTKLNGKIVYIVIKNAIIIECLKEILVFKIYLVILPVSLRILFTKFRLSNHNLPIEWGRHWNIERCERKCIQCNVLGDEFHCLFICPLFSDARKLVLRKGYQSNITADKYNTLFSSKNYQKLSNLTKFVNVIMTELKNRSFKVNKTVN